jgi:hypothetical protein
MSIRREDVDHMRVLVKDPSPPKGKVEAFASPDLGTPGDEHFILRCHYYLLLYGLAGNLEAHLSCNTIDPSDLSLCTVTIQM